MFSPLFSFYSISLPLVFVCTFLNIPKPYEVYSVLKKQSAGPGKFKQIWLKPKSIGSEYNNYVIAKVPVKFSENTEGINVSLT